MAEVAVSHLASVLSGYLVTGLSLAGYIGYLVVRARRARLRSAAIGAKRTL